MEVEIKDKGIRRILMWRLDGVINGVRVLTQVDFEKVEHEILRDKLKIIGKDKYMLQIEYEDGEVKVFEPDGSIRFEGNVESS